MVCEMETDQIEEMDVEVLSSMWPEDVGTELLNSTPQGSSQLTNLVKQWEYMQENAVRLLREELKNLNRQREEAEAKELKIIEEHNFESNETENVPVLDETSDLFGRFQQKKKDALVDNKKVEIEEEAVEVETDVQGSDQKEEDNDQVAPSNVIDYETAASK